MTTKRRGFILGHTWNGKRPFHTPCAFFLTQGVFLPCVAICTKTKRKSLKTHENHVKTEI